MKKAGQLAGVSDSLIAHIETGRMNPPKGPHLERLLLVYGGIKEKSFYERVRTHQTKRSPREELLELLERANHTQVATILQIVRGILG